jgi:hypothetical protein
VTTEWPQGWIPIYCQCDALIGGYRQQDQPDLIEIQHRCVPNTAIYYVTMIVK